MLEVTLDTRRKVCRQVRRLRPEVLVAPDPRACGRATATSTTGTTSKRALLALTAVMPDAPTRLMFPELLEKGLEPLEVPNLYLASNEPDVYVDITATMERKLAALAAHVSQRRRPRRRGSVNEPKGLRRRADGRSRMRRRSRRSASWTTRSSTMEDLPGPDEPHELTRRGARGRRRGPGRPRGDARGVLCPERQGRGHRVPGLRAEPLLRVGAAEGQPGAHARDRRAAYARAGVRDRTRTSTSSGTTARATSTPSPTPASNPAAPSIQSLSCPWCTAPSIMGNRYCPRCGRPAGGRHPPRRAGPAGHRRA